MLVPGRGQKLGYDNARLIAQDDDFEFHAPPPSMVTNATPPVFHLLLRKLRSWRGRPLAEKLWFGPAFLLLGIARAALLTVAFRRLAPLLGQGLQTAALVPLATEAEIVRALHIGRAVRLAANYTPWESKCLAQAMVARVLLGMKRLPYALYLGVSKSGDANMEAHAWVCVGHAAITGGHSFGRFTVVGTFVSPGLVS